MFPRALILTLIALGLCSCGPGKPPAPPADSVAGLGAPTTTARAGNTDMPVIPPNAQYTLFCRTLVGPDHIEQSRSLRAALAQASPLKDWYVVHGADKSIVYYGFYRTVDPRDPADPHEGQRALHDMASIRNMIDTAGTHPFAACLPVPIDSPDPAANPAWDLRRSPGYYSLEIASYQGSPQRKEAAVEAVREARAQGIEAYYYHGDSASSVCIGAWPKESVHESSPADQNVDPDVPLVLTATPMPEQVADQFKKQGYNTVAPDVQPVDPDLLQTMCRFPDHSVNGEVLVTKGTDRITGKPVDIRSPSFIVKIPHGDESTEPNIPMASSGAPTDTAALPNVPPPPRQPAAPAPGIGGLKSIGSN